MSARQAAEYAQRARGAGLKSEAKFNFLAQAIEELAKAIASIEDEVNRIRNSLKAR
jgi:outer membrane murein-binding lipoprotein Lpp